MAITELIVFFTEQCVTFLEELHLLFVAGDDVATGAIVGNDGCDGREDG